MKHLYAVIAFALLTGTAHAVTYHVPGDFATIQDAINAASDGDVILIEAGTYNETYLNTDTKAVHVKGTTNSDGVPITRIDGGGEDGNILLIDAGETETTIFEDLIISNGYAGNGAAMFLDGTSPTIRNCIFESNTAYHDQGGAVYCFDCSAQFTGCTFQDNTAETIGGAVWIDGSSSPSFVECTFADNTANGPGGGGIYCEPNTGVTLSDCIFSGNVVDGVWGGGGLCLEDNVIATV
ncbi:MAG: right-handed parallel beta-helix repeat-containing protein, partial [Phycisphaerales bacterium]|nr:right-handed parallel beta-helix repeat-containing protein [Phycisphaerales bacterium]